MSDKAFRLLEYHQRLDDKLRCEMKQRWPDILKIARLKKMKLMAKDKLSRLSRRNRLSKV